MELLKYQLRGIALILFGILITVAKADWWIIGMLVGLFGLLITWANRVK